MVFIPNDMFSDFESGYTMQELGKKYKLKNYYLKSIFNSDKSSELLPEPFNAEKEMEKRKNRMINVMLYGIVCKQCGNKFYPETESQRGTRKFCSRPCVYKFYKINKILIKRKEKVGKPRYSILPEHELYEESAIEYMEKKKRR